jgi:hypothetical protein
MAYHVREGGSAAIEANRKLARLLWYMPGLRTEFFANFDRKGPEDFARAFGAHPGGVLSRHRSGPWAPVQVLDLIGVAPRKYLDRTGLQQNRGPEDLMRYAALNQGGFCEFRRLHSGERIRGADTRPQGWISLQR